MHGTIFITYVEFADLPLVDFLLYGADTLLVKQVTDGN